MVKLLRLQQVTGGCVPTDDAVVHRVDSAKLKLLADTLEDIGTEEPVVVFGRFHADLDAVHEACIQVTGPTNHDDFLYSIYFFDPSGHRLELSAHTATAEQDRQFRSEAMEVLNLWDRTHDWSQRAVLFGGASGYGRKDGK